MSMISLRRKKPTNTSSSEVLDNVMANSSAESSRSSARECEIPSNRSSSHRLTVFGRVKADHQSPRLGAQDHPNSNSHTGSMVSLFNLAKLRSSFEDLRESMMPDEGDSSGTKTGKATTDQLTSRNGFQRHSPRYDQQSRELPTELPTERPTDDPRLPIISVESSGEYPSGPSSLSRGVEEGTLHVGDVPDTDILQSRSEKSEVASKSQEDTASSSMEKKIGLFLLSGTSDTAFRSPLLKFKKKTVSRLSFIDDDKNDNTSPSPSPGELSQTSLNQISDHPEEELSSKRSSGESSSLQPGGSARAFPLLRSLSSQSQENRDSSTISNATKIENRRRSRTLNSLIGDKKSPPTRPSISSLFGAKLRSDSESRSLSRRHSPCPRPSLTAPQSNMILPEREHHTSAEEYLKLLQKGGYGGNTAALLSCQDDPFFQSVLQKYTDSFNFADEPVDMALRKFLMYVKLPRETQQIDRVLECFSSTYHRQNDRIYSDAETTYVVVFSLMILHTDIFNKNNRHKMQKNEYVRNTYAKGVSREILECFYDNITYTPFIHTDEDFSQANSVRPKKSSFGRSSKDLVDPYALMLEGRLNMIRPSLASVLKLEDPYSFPKVDSTERYMQIRKDFIQGRCLQLTSQRSRPEAFLKADSTIDPDHSLPGTVDIKVVKIGILLKREPRRMLYSKSNWREWGAILTASQLYLFKDVSWIKNSILSEPDYSTDSDHSKEGEGIIKASIDGFHPSSVLSTIDMAALFSANLDTSQPYSFLLASRGGAQEIFAASCKEQMEDWMLKINYASAFNTYHIGIYGGGAVDRPKKLISLRSASSISLHSESSTSISRGFRNKETHLMRILTVDNKLEEIQKKWEMVEEQLKEYIMNGDHLKLLAPIQQRTRENVIFSAGRLAAKLDWHWLDRKRLLCYQDMFQTEKQVETELYECFDVELAAAGFAGAIASIPSNPSIPSLREDEVNDENACLEKKVPVGSPIKDGRGESILSSAESDYCIFEGEKLTVKHIERHTSSSAGAATSDSTELKVPKKGFHQRSLRSTTSRKERHAPVPEQQRSASLIRQSDGNFTLHGKQFSVVQVNPEFAATPNHQRTPSQPLVQQAFDKASEKDAHDST